MDGTNETHSAARESVSPLLVATVIQMLEPRSKPAQLEALGVQDEDFTEMLVILQGSARQRMDRMHRGHLVSELVRQTDMVAGAFLIGVEFGKGQR